MMHKLLNIIKPVITYTRKTTKNKIKQNEKKGDTNQLDRKRETWATALATSELHSQEFLFLKKKVKKEEKEQTERNKGKKKYPCYKCPVWSGMLSGLMALRGSQKGGVRTKKRK